MKLVGIDLGTTNIAVAWGEESGAIRMLDMPQLVTRRERESRALLPSTLYAPTSGEIASDPPWIVGTYARARAAEAADRVISSHKSWLGAPHVDRHAAILPWGSEASDVQRVSPVDAAATCLLHVRTAWDAAFPAEPLELQRIVLTLPASFDEVARELTLTAAKRAGLDAQLRLLEEPQAAFYDWINRQGSHALETLAARHGGRALVLVCDIGGGTTDLSLVEVQGNELRRLAVGRHLLLGGDNMDLALAHACEPRLGGALPPTEFAALVAACRTAKEALLSANAPSDWPIAIASRGSALVGQTRRTAVTRDEAEALVLEGFFPRVSRDDRPARQRAALVSFGLPYERDAAISRHIADFWARHAPNDAGPDAVLVNGGVFHAERIAERIVSMLSEWRKADVELLPQADPDLAVARGAVVYARTLLGHGRVIRGGSPRAYYVGLGADQAVCILPQGAEEGVVYTAGGRSFALTLGTLARFDLFASERASHDEPGALVTVDEQDFSRLPPLVTTIGGGTGEAHVRLEAEVTPLGTLDLHGAEEPPRTGARHRLSFQLRDEASPKRSIAPILSSAPPRSSGTLESRRIDEARSHIDRVWGKKAKDTSPREIKDVIRSLEKTLGERATWTLETSRTLFDTLWPLRSARRRSADHERIFWLLFGFCARPGFGDPLDAGRVAGAWPLFAERLAFPASARGWQAFFIAWRRMVGGLAEAEQVHIRNTLDPFFFPGDKRFKKPKFDPLAMDDMRELVASLERVPTERRTDIGEWLLERTWVDEDSRLWAAIGRVGARVPGYASVHHVVPASVAERWLEQLLRQKWERLPSAPLAAVQLARRTGDRTRDVSDRARREIAKKLVATGARQDYVAAVEEVVEIEEAERSAFLGESLPVGLRIL